MARLFPFVLALAGAGCSKGEAPGKVAAETGVTIEGPLERCALARGGRALLEGLASAHVRGTIFHFDLEGKGTRAAESLEAMLRFPDRARFAISVGRASRIVLLRGEAGDARMETALVFSPLEGEALLSWRKQRLLHVVAARFPALPGAISVEPGEGGAAVAEGGLSLRVEVDPETSLPSVLRFEGEEEAVSLGDWRESRGAPLLPHLLRAESGGRTLSEERIATWQRNPSLLDRLFEAPQASAPEQAPLETPRVLEEKAFGLAAVEAVMEIEAVADSVEALRKGPLAEAKVVVFFDADRKPAEIGLVPTSPGPKAVRTVEDARVAEVYLRGTFTEALGWVERLAGFAREQGEAAEGGFRLMRAPDDWKEPEAAPAVYRLILPLRPK